MSTRSELFTAENLQALPGNHPFLLLFLKTDWGEYLELIARIYDVLEENHSRVEFDRVRAIVDTFYTRRKSLAHPELKRGEFFKMAIAELELLRDSHDAAGRRYLEATREGKLLLKWMGELILNRRRFTGTGAETLLGALNDLLAAGGSWTEKEAIEHHRQRIREYKEDIERIRREGVAASELLSSGFSAEELLSQAEEAASHILSAGEDIKLAVEGARRKLAARYRSGELTSGQAVEFVADFHDALRSTPEYASFSRAKDILSYLDGLGSGHRYKDVTEIYHRLLDQAQALHDLEPASIRRSQLGDFSRRFHLTIKGIEEKVQDQVGLLRVQIHYVLKSDSWRTREALAGLLSLLSENGASALDFLRRNPHRFNAGLEIAAGALRPHPFEMDSSEAPAAVEWASLSEDQEWELLRRLRDAEEAGIADVLTRLESGISRHGEIRLSRYPLEHGILELYVLSRVESFTKSIASEALGSFDLELDAESDAPRAWIRNVPDRRYFFV